MRPGARAIRPYVVRQWKALAGAGGATVVLTAADLAKPWPLALVVNALLDKQAPFSLTSGDWTKLDWGSRRSSWRSRSPKRARSTCPTCGCRARASGSPTTCARRCTTASNRSRSASIRKRQKGDLLTRVTGDVNAMADLFAEQIGAIAQAALLAVGMTVVLLILDPLLALVSVATSPLLLAIAAVSAAACAARRACSAPTTGGSPRSPARRCRPWPS